MAMVECGGQQMLRPGVHRDLMKSWYAASNWRWMRSGVESGSSCLTPTDQHSWKGIWWDWAWIATGRSGLDTVVVVNHPLPPHPQLKCQAQTCQLLSMLNPTRSLSRSAGLLVSYTSCWLHPGPHPPPVWGCIRACPPIPTHPGLSIRWPATFHPRPSGTGGFASVYYILLLRRATVIWPRCSFSFCFISICLGDAHPRAERHSRWSSVSAALSPSIFVCFLPSMVFLIILYNTYKY